MGSLLPYQAPWAVWVPLSSEQRKIRRKVQAKIRST
jgi:hypothetical protein